MIGPSDSRTLSRIRFNAPFKLSFISYRAVGPYDICALPRSPCGWEIADRLADLTNSRRESRLFCYLRRR